jgi:poly(3-hydroxybutyrate) depolymerase
MCNYLPKDVRKEYEASYGTPLHEHFVHVDGLRRRFLLYEPGVQNRPVWLLAPGTVSPAEQILAISGLYDVARRHKFALVVLEGFHCTFNVQSKSQQIIPHPNDIGYTLKVLRITASRTSPDMTRIQCVGYSNGARFCCRLASELSNLITGFATVAGIRYPIPNNATLPMPAIAFHGVKDPVNPFWGHGNPAYWHTSVPDALQGWARFNGCSRKKYERMNESVSIESYVQCHEGADVVVWRMEEGGHTWPGSDYDFSRFGLRFGHTSAINANEAMRQFFDDHPRTICHTAVSGERCYYDVEWARTQGFHVHPEWYVGLSNTSTFEEVQDFLHRSIRANCPRPCMPDGAEPATASRSPATFPFIPVAPAVAKLEKGTAELPQAAVAEVGRVDTAATSDGPLGWSAIVVGLMLVMTVVWTIYASWRSRGAGMKGWRPVSLRNFSLTASCRESPDPDGGSVTNPFVDSGSDGVGQEGRADSEEHLITQAEERDDDEMTQIVGETSTPSMLDHYPIDQEHDLGLYWEDTVPPEGHHLRPDLPGQVPQQDLAEPLTGRGSSSLGSSLGFKSERVYSYVHKEGCSPPRPRMPTPFSKH